MLKKSEVIKQIKTFLDGSNNDLKYLVNVETDSNTNVANCIIHEPNQPARIELHSYTPYMYVKDLKKYNKILYNGDINVDNAYKKTYGIETKTLKTGNQKRLKEGYTTLVTSTKSFNSIIDYFKCGGIDVYEKAKTRNGRLKKNSKGDNIYVNRDFFYSLKTNEQFFISRKVRLFKGFEEYKEIHKLIIDAETEGLRYTIHRLISIGLKDNRGFEKVLEVEKENDDASEIKLIEEFFKTIYEIKPAIIAGFNSEDFDFDFILGRVEVLKMKLNTIITTLSKSDHIKRYPKANVKIGGSSEKYTATKMWGYSIIDIIHAAKRTAAQNSEMKNTKLKYLAKFEDIAKSNRTYIDGAEGQIGKIWKENKLFVVNENNQWKEIPNEYQKCAKELHTIQLNKNNLIGQQDITITRLNEKEYNVQRNNIFNNNKKFVEWLRTVAIPNKMDKFITGKNLVKQYNIDDLWETEQIDELYNQSSFLLAKIVPTNYQRICTMGTAGIWNLLMCAWSYDNDLAIPSPDKKIKFSGGLARTFRGGFNKRLVKIDFGSLYPYIQLSENVFPIFDITGALKMMLIYTTTVRNIFKKLSNSDKLDEEEVELLLLTDKEAHKKYINNNFTDEERKGFKIKQQPLKILNNSQFGSLGSAYAFNWSDGDCAAKITCVARLHLRHTIVWFNKYGCIPLLMVTDGVNFKIPDKTKFRITDKEIIEENTENLIENMWKFNGKVGINGLIEKYNDELKREAEALGKSISVYVDNDGEFISCLNLSRINYALLYEKKNKKTGIMEQKVKLTGNSLKSRVMPEYIEEFIEKGMRMLLEGKGIEFVNYYYNYIKEMFDHKIPLKKIASKSKVKMSIEDYKRRGKDKNGREKGKKAHMELLILERKKTAREIFKERFNEFKQEFEKMIKENILQKKEEYTYEELLSFVGKYMPPPPELDSYVYYVNTGYKQSDGDSAIIIDKKTGKSRICSTFISNKDLEENPNLIGDYNIFKYFNALNKKVKIYLEGYDPEVKKEILSKIKKEKLKELYNKEDAYPYTVGHFTDNELELKSFVIDDFNNSLVLEDKEVDFWNKTGYDPRLIWNGFTVREDKKVHFEIYENALNYLNKKMVDSGKPKIKSVNDILEKGDLILLKNDFEYNVGCFNGQYIEIIRENVDIPKSETEQNLQKIYMEEDTKYQQWVIDNMEGMKKLVNADEVTEDDQDKLLEYFNKFKEEHSELPQSLTISQMLEVNPSMKYTFLNYIENCESDDEDVILEDD